MASKAAKDGQSLKLVEVTPHSSVDVVERHGVRVVRGAKPVAVDAAQLKALLRDSDERGVPLVRVVAASPAETPDAQE